LSFLIIAKKERFVSL